MLAWGRTVERACSSSATFGHEGAQATGARAGQLRNEAGLVLAVINGRACHAPEWPRVSGGAAGGVR